MFRIGRFIYFIYRWPLRDRRIDFTYYGTDNGTGVGWIFILFTY